jgi:hypothetical protein
MVSTLDTTVNSAGVQREVVPYPDGGGPPDSMSDQNFAAAWRAPGLAADGSGLLGVGRRGCGPLNTIGPVSMILRLLLTRSLRRFVADTSGFEEPLPLFGCLLGGVRPLGKRDRQPSRPLRRTRRGEEVFEHPDLDSNDPQFI